MKDVFDIQDEISRAIVQALKVRLVGVPDTPLLKRHTENTEAYQYYLKGRDLWNARGLDLKKAQLRRAIEIKPDFVFTHWLFGQACLANSRSLEAIDAFKRAAELSGNAAWAVASVAQGQAAAGDKERAGKLLAELEVRSRQDYVSSWFLALVYAALDEREQVFAMLERAHEEGDMYLLWTKCHFAFDPFHRDSRYAEVLRKIRLDG